MKKAIMVLHIVVLCILILGAIGGAFYYAQKVSPSVAKSNVAEESLSAFRSKVIGSITAFGQVTSVSGRIITLDQGGDKLSIRVKDTAEVISYGASGRTPASFSDIRQGQILNIEISILPSNQLEGRAVIIFTDLKR